MQEEKRKSDYPIHPMILNRHSPRAMTGETLSDEEIFSLFEAARWAPSSYNEQPWRFLYAKRETAHWPLFFELLIDFNKEWCANAALLGVILSCTAFERNHAPSPTHSLDAGAAWENLALEGTQRGFVVHGMQGFNYQKAREILQIPDLYQIHAMFAVGKRAPKETLSEALQKKEVLSQRKKISEFAFEGKFPK